MNFNADIDELNENGPVVKAAISQRSQPARRAGASETGKLERGHLRPHQKDKSTA
jgi:hypothetical protein